jgi:arylsulfatase A-like enzyme
MYPKDNFPAKLKDLWFRLVSLAIVGLIFVEALTLAAGKIQGWSFYLTTFEVIYEIAVRLIVTALIGIGLGTIGTVVASPFLWYFRESRERVVAFVTRAAVALIVFLDSRFALPVLVKWVNRGIRFIPALLVAHIVAFAILLCIRSTRKEIMTSLDSFLGEKITRGMVLTTVVGLVLLIGFQLAIRSGSDSVNAQEVKEPPKTNFLLITFDALNAEDMSLYGREFPTTPNIDAFANQAVVFTNFYSGSTFTTPSVATMMTGMYPSESHVQHLQGELDPEFRNQSLPQLLKAAGYSNAAFLSNPFAYYLGKSAGGFELFPEPAFQQGGLERVWNASRLLHQDSGFGCRVDEYIDLGSVWNSLFRLPGNLCMRFRPDATFGHAQQLLNQLPDGYFLWVHVITPHNPYLPDPADRGRFLPPDKVHTYEEWAGGRWKPNYPSDQQSLVDERRLRYDEFIATADRAFGAFMADFVQSRKSKNTVVIVSADHGESFEGGVYQHSSPYLTRPVIHIPLIIKLPDQREGHKVAAPADQTAFAPTILELAGRSKPQSMRGESLVKWLKKGSAEDGKGLAFSQYLERNSAFSPLEHGMIAVMDGTYQYVIDLETQKGALRPLNQAHFWNLDKTAENPARAAELRAAIQGRFPDLVKKKP